MIEVPVVHAWAAPFYDSTEAMSDDGKAYVRWLDAQKDKQAKDLARAIRRYDSDLYFRSDPEAWFERYTEALQD